MNRRMRTILGFYPTTSSNLLSMFFEVMNAGISLLAAIQTEEREKQQGCGSGLSSFDMISRGDQRYDEDDFFGDEEENPSPELIDITFQQMLSTNEIMNLDVKGLLSSTLEGMRGAMGEEQYAQLCQSLA
jgi:hypothetical protein